MTMYGFLTGEPGKKVTLGEYQTGIAGDYFIMGYLFEISPGSGGNSIITWTPVAKSDAGYLQFFAWGKSAWGGPDTWS
jgi:hypothetical protein